MSTEMVTFETDSKWFYENIRQLQAQNFSGKFVAVQNEQVIASDSNLDFVLDMLIKSGKNPAYLVIEFVHPEGTVVLL